MNLNRKAMIAALALLCSLPVSAQRVSLKASNVTVKQAITELKEQTGYSFVFSSEDLNTQKRVSVSANNVDLSVVVEQILKGQKGIDYKIEGKNVIITKANHNSVKPTSAAPTTKSNGQRVAGRILDENGEPMIGVTITADGMKGGTVTDLDGNFVLEDVPESTKNLHLSYIGYSDKTVPVGSNLNVKMSPDNTQLDEVVVVGYGTVKKTDLTGLSQPSNPTISTRVHALPHRTR